MATQQLSTAQRKAIRAVHDGKYPGVPPNTTARTIVSLVRRGYVTINGETMEASLTRTGRVVYDAIMATGDGPEDLKAKLRFGGQR